MNHLRSYLFARRPASLVLVAALLLSLTATLFVSPASATAAGRGASFYIKIAVTETTTTVGQQPKIVVTYGNNGGKTFDDFEGECYATKGKLEFTDVIYDLHDLIPGQNDNVTFVATALSAGTTNVQCEMVAYYTDKSGVQEVFKRSNIVKVVIKKP